MPQRCHVFIVVEVTFFVHGLHGCWAGDVLVAVYHIIALIIASRTTSDSFIDSETGLRTSSDEVRWSRREDASELHFGHSDEHFVFARQELGNGDTVSRGQE